MQSNQNNKPPTSMLAVPFDKKIKRTFYVSKSFTLKNESGHDAYVFIKEINIKNTESFGIGVQGNNVNRKVDNSKIEVPDQIIPILNGTDKKIHIRGNSIKISVYFNILDKWVSCYEERTVDIHNVDICITTNNYNTALNIPANTLSKKEFDNKLRKKI